MASGNSWQLYQELGRVPSSLTAALKQKRRSPRTLRRDSLTAPFALNTLQYAGRREEEAETGRPFRRHSFAYGRATSSPGGAPSGKGAAETLFRKWQQRRSVSFRVAKEKTRQLWKRAKTFLDVTVLSAAFATPPPSPDTWSTASTSNDDLYRTASSDISEAELYSDEGANEIDFGERRVVSTYAQFDYAHNGRCRPVFNEWFLENDDAHLESYLRHRHPPSIRVTNPDCPLHGNRVSAANPRAGRHFLEVPSPSGHLIPIRIGSRETVADKVSTDRATKPVSGRRKIAVGWRPRVSNTTVAVKLARRRHKAAMTPAERQRVEREKSKIRRNLLTLSVAFLFLISAFQGLQNLQTTVNGDDGLGAISLSVVYVGLVVSCLFTPPYLLNRLGCKLTLILCTCVYALYMLTHFSPRWYSLIPGSLLVGFAAAPLWAAKCAYLCETGVRYAELNLESSNFVIVRFFGIFFMIVHLGQVFGNLMSSWILQAAVGADSPPRDAVDDTCGHFFTNITNLSPVAKLNLARPPANAVYSLCGVYFCCTIVAALIIVMFLNQLRQDVHIKKEKPHFKLDIWNMTVQHLKQPRHMLLVPLTIFNGMEQAFMAGEFTKAYVGCCLGITHIGYVMTSFGMCDAVCSLVFGPLIKLFGRMPLFMFGAVVDMLMIFTLLIWPPNPADTAIFYVVAACWGMADGVWNTQINGLWVVLFADNLETAFANYRLWESVGFIIAFAYTPFLVTETKLYLLLAMLYVGMVGYGLIELWEPLEDYAVRLRQRIHSSSSLRMSKNARSRKPPTSKKKNGVNDEFELTESLLSTSNVAFSGTQDPNVSTPVA